MIGRLIRLTTAVAVVAQPGATAIIAYLLEHCRARTFGRRIPLHPDIDKSFDSGRGRDRPDHQYRPQE